MISAKIIVDSKNQFGNRITTMVVTFPRIILAEFNTHRMFSRNTASSRAVPFDKMLMAVRSNPFIPIAWQKDHKGMQGTEYFKDEEDEEPSGKFLYKQWQIIVDQACDQASLMSEMGVTKQLCNRLIEPFMWTTAIVTATEWENFFALRCPKYEINVGGGHDLNDDIKARSWKDLMKSPYAGDFDTDNLIERLFYNKGQAEIHMMALAEAMWDAYQESQPKELKGGEWHIPFGDQFDKSLLHESFCPSNPDELGTMNEEWELLKIKIATARCARISYTVVGEEGKVANYENDIKLHDRLAQSGHWSPFEHCAQAMTELDYDNNWHCDYGQVDGGWSGNFKGFYQYRKTFENENII